MTTEDLLAAALRENDKTLHNVVNELEAAERRIAAALAEHYYRSGGDCTCGYPWDTVADRCTSPTVNALQGDQ